MKKLYSEMILCQRTSYIIIPYNIMAITNIVCINRKVNCQTGLTR